jgi:hypothetical protein
MNLAKNSISRRKKRMKKNRMRKRVKKNNTHPCPSSFCLLQDE